MVAPKYVQRRARLEDIGAIVDLATLSVAIDPLPVKIDREAMADTARSLINPAHFLWVTEEVKTKQVVAAVAACAQRSFWYKGLQVSVLLYYSKTPGAGLPLIREFAKWCKGRPAVKVAVVELEPNTDPRIIRAFERMGFKRNSVNLSYVRMPT